jgi:hypothetical protein
MTLAHAENVRTRCNTKTAAISVQCHMHALRRAACRIAKPGLASLRSSSLTSSSLSSSSLTVLFSVSSNFLERIAVCHRLRFHQRCPERFSSNSRCWSRLVYRMIPERCQERLCRPHRSNDGAGRFVSDSFREEPTPHALPLAAKSSVSMSRSGPDLDRLLLQGISNVPSTARGDRSLGSS